MSEEAFKEVDVNTVKSLLEDGYEIVDVREDWEWKKGHIPGAKHVVLSSILGNPHGQSVTRPSFSAPSGNARP